MGAGWDRGRAHPFEITGGGGGGLISKGCARPRSHPAPATPPFETSHHDIPLASVQMTDTFCSFIRNVTFVTCFLLPK